MMQIGYFDKNVTGGLVLIIGMIKKGLATERDNRNVQFHHIDKLSYLEGKNNKLRDAIDILIINPNLNETHWEMLSEFVEKHPELKLIFVLTCESREIFEEKSFIRFPNIETCLWKNFPQRIKQLVEES